MLGVIATFGGGVTANPGLAQAAPSSSPMAAAAVPPRASAAGPATALQLDKSGPAGVLAGASADFTLAASNPAGPGAVPLYNVSFRDVLAPGVSYQSGSTTPADLGDPRIITAMVEFPVGSANLVTQQTLIWSNVADLQIGADFSVGYSVSPNATLYPVSAAFTNDAESFASTNPRFVPRFTAAGLPIDGATITTSGVDSVTVPISAISLAKSDDASVEGNLLRGVHNNISIYTLEVTNNSVDSTTDLELIDYLPAELEFLGCGDEENTTAAAAEYPTSGPLGAGRTVDENCLVPTSVRTVVDPNGLTGVFTEVRWNLADLAAGETVKISYTAAIPLRANTDVWPSGEPTAANLGQGSNLDNNTGATTRQDGAGLGLTNHAQVSGTYQGMVAPGGTTAAEDVATHTVVAKDVRVQKAVNTGDGFDKSSSFHVGEVATYSLQVDTSEYTSAENIVLTDELSNGLCPLMSNSQWMVLIALYPSLTTITNCVAQPGQEASLSTGAAFGFDSVTYNPLTGNFTVTFTPITAVAEQSSVTATYFARMLLAYPGGALAGTQTSAGDSFANTVELAATSLPIAGTGETGPWSVTDSSGAELVTDSAAISKTILPQPEVPATDTPVTTAAMSIRSIRYCPLRAPSSPPVTWCVLSFGWILRPQLGRATRCSPTSCRQGPNTFRGRRSWRRPTPCRQVMSASMTPTRV